MRFRIKILSTVSLVLSLVLLFSNNIQIIRNAFLFSRVICSLPDLRNPRDYKHGRVLIEPCHAYHSEFRRGDDRMDTEMFAQSNKGYTHSESTLHIQDGLRYI